MDIKGKHWKVKDTSKYKIANKLKNLGRHHSDTAKQKISKNGMGKHIGKLNGNYKGGVSKIDKLCRRMVEYRQWRSDVFQRDNWTCQTCRINGIYITAHHIKSFSKIIKENNIKSVSDARKCSELWDTNNGVTLCEECHKLTDNYKGRSISKIKK